MIYLELYVDLQTRQIAVRSGMFSPVNILTATNVNASEEFLRRLSITSSALDNFRAVNGKGMRGMMDGGIFIHSSPLGCAERCAADRLCLSFDFESLSSVCYISHTDRYAHPEVFLDFPSGIYYEWQGTAASPAFFPDGGVYTTQTVTRLITTQLAAVIYYRILPANATISTTVESLFGSGQNYSSAVSGDYVTLPTYSCKVYAIAVKPGLDNSTMAESSEFTIFGGYLLFPLVLMHLCVVSNSLLCQLQSMRSWCRTLMAPSTDS